jgi:hypothetical protein
MNLLDSFEEIGGGVWERFLFGDYLLQLVTEEQWDEYKRTSEHLWIWVVEVYDMDNDEHVEFHEGRVWMHTPDDAYKDFQNAWMSDLIQEEPV